MKHSHLDATGPRDLLRQAEYAASKGDEKRSLELFERCIQEYTDKRMTFKALAAAKHAKTIIGAHPKIHALLIQLYLSMGLRGDAEKELLDSSSALKKDEVLILRGLSVEEFVDFLDIIEIHNVRKGESILKQDETGEDIFIVVEGSIEVVRDSKRVSTMVAGDIFGELGFFHHARRSATVRALEKSMIIKIPSGPLRRLCKRSESMRISLENLYSKRILKKASEDLSMYPLVDLYKDDLTSIHLSKGQTIPFDNTTDITIVKHGVVEVDYDNRRLREKRFFRPGSVIKRFSGIARANTDVELIRARIDLVGNRDRSSE